MAIMDLSDISKLGCIQPWISPVVPVISTSVSVINPVVRTIVNSIVEPVIKSSVY
jgi:hypothetical protein